MEDQGRIIELDERGRASLGNLARYRHYVLEKFEDGMIVLHPRILVPPNEGE